MSFSSKREISKNQKEKDNLQSAGDTFFDSLHNSKISENTKNNFVQPNNKENTIKTHNFYLALKCMLGPDIDTFLLGTSEFSEKNPNQTREENISRYLHRPIIKEINKEGNNLVRIKPMQNYASSNVLNSTTGKLKNWILKPNDNSSLNWTISPSSLCSQCAFEWESSGAMDGGHSVNQAGAIRPVLSLKSDTLLNASGDGSYSNPYVISGT